MAKKQSDKENRKDDNSVVASTSSASSRELGDTPKPETKVCKRYKEQSRLETKSGFKVGHEMDFCVFNKIFQ